VSLQDTEKYNLFVGRLYYEELLLSEERIAIVGMGALLPDANNVDSFWNNILSKKVSIKELPESILNPDIYYDRDAFGKINKNDKTYTRMVAKVDVDDYPSLTRKFKIPLRWQNTWIQTSMWQFTVWTRLCSPLQTAT